MFEYNMCPKFLKLLLVNRLLSEPFASRQPELKLICCIYI